MEDEKLYLLPVRGSDTQWYKNVLENRSLQVDAPGGPAALDLDPVTDPARVSAVIEKFRAKYGDRDLKRYYSKLDVAIVGELR